MVSISEAKSQISQARTALQARQKQIQDTKLRSLTRSELGRRNQQDLINRKQLTRQLTGQKQEALKQLEPFRQEITTAETQVQQAEVAQRQAQQKAGDFAKAQDVFSIVSRADPESREQQRISTLTEEQLRIFRLLERSESQAQEKIFQEIRDLGGEPVIRNGKVVGAEIAFMSVTLESLQKGINLTPISTPQTPDITPPPSSIQPATSFEKFQGFFQKRGLRDPISGFLGSGKLPDPNKVEKPSLVEDVAGLFEVPESQTREKPVLFINLPSTAGGTQQTRPVSILDVDTGVLPPKQNLQIKTDQTLTRFSQGLISESAALQQLENAEKKFILDESKRLKGSAAAGGFAFGLVSRLAPPVGFAVAGAGAITTFQQRKQIIAFAKENPQAAAISFTSSIVGMVLGGKVGGLLKAPKVPKAPTIKFLSKDVSKGSEILRLGSTAEADFALLLQQKRITGARIFDVTIPTLKKNTNLNMRILEFQKDGLRRFVGQTFRTKEGRLLGKRVKPTGRLEGQTIVAQGEGGLAQVITRTIRTNTKLNQVQLSQIIEKIKVKSKAKTEGTLFETRLITLTENEAKLSKQFDIKGLTPKQVRLLFRTRLFGKAEAGRLAKTPFSEQEFNLAKGLTKTEVLSATKLLGLEAKAGFTPLKDGAVITLTGSEATQTLGLGKSKVNILELPKPQVKTKVKISSTGEITPAGKITSLITSNKKGQLQAFDSFGFKVKVKQIPVTKQKPKTPLSKTFQQQEVTPASTLSELGKSLRKDIVKQQSKTISRQETFASSLIGIPRATGGAGLTETQIRQAQGRDVLEFELLGEKPPINSPVTLVSTRNAVNQLIQPKALTALFQPTQLRNLTKELVEQQDINKLSTKTKVTFEQGIRNKQVLRESLKFIQRQKFKQKQQQKQQQKFLQQRKQVTKQRFAVPPVLPSFDSFITDTGKATSKDNFLYDTFVKKRIKTKEKNEFGQFKFKESFVKIADDLPRNRAIRRGAIHTDRNLGATFKIVRDRKARPKKRVKDIKRGRPNPKVFRNYRISKGRKIPMKDKWIEFSKARLNTKSEVSQIKRAKRRSKKKR